MIHTRGVQVLSYEAEGGILSMLIVLVVLIVVFFNICLRGLCAFLGGVWGGFFLFYFFKGF